MPRVDNHRPRIAVIIIHIADWVGQTIELIIAKANICLGTQPWNHLYQVPISNDHAGLLLPRVGCLPPSCCCRDCDKRNAGRWPICVLAVIVVLTTMVDGTPHSIARTQSSAVLANSNFWFFSFSVADIHTFWQGAENRHFHEEQ